VLLRLPSAVVVVVVVVRVGVMPQTTVSVVAASPSMEDPVGKDEQATSMTNKPVTMELGF